MTTTLSHFLPCWRLACAVALVATTVAQAASFTLNWDDNSDDESGFRVERSTNDAAFVQIVELPANTTTYVDAAATDGAKHVYRVRAYNAVGNSDYSNVVTNAPVITQQPADQTVSVLQNVTFTAAASGIPAPTFQWRKGTTNLTNTGVVSGATTASLVLTGISFADSGTYSVIVSNGIGTPLTSADATLTVNRSPQTITFAAPPTKVFTDAPFDLGATSSSGLTVSYTSSNTSVATVSGSTVTIVGVGTSTITASQAGNDTYLPATSVPRTLTVNKGNQTITFDALTPVTFGVAPFQLTASSTSNLPVTFASSNGAVATISGNTLTVVSGGTVTITASQAGNSSFNAANNVQRTLTINKADQTITFNALPAMVLGDAPITLTATSSSGLPVAYSSSQLSVARVTGSTLTLFGGGSTVITAGQSGNASYNAAPSLQQTLQVFQAPVFSTHPPSSPTTTAGFTLNMTVAANGLPVPTLKWQISTNSGSSWQDLADAGIYSGTTTTNFRITGVTADLNGAQFRAVATNSVAAIPSSAATLTVQTAPAFTTQPENRFAATGGNATFTAVASGNPAPTLQWQISDTAGGSTFTNLSNNATYSGVTTGTLSITNATAGLNGFRYRAVATNVVTSTPSTFATLTVGNVAPAFTTSPVNATIPAGTNTTFTAAASGGPAPTLKWQLSTDGGTNWTDITNGGVYSGATTGTLSITGAGIGLHNNRYRAVATNTAGTVESAGATLTITTTAPSFTEHPTAQSAPDGGTATFTAAANGNPTPTLKWQLSTDGGTNWADIANGGVYSGATTGSLTLTGVSPALNGHQYRAVATNTDVSGTPVSTNSNAATFTIGNVAPIFTAHPENQLIPAGANTTFTVAVTGNPAPTLKWETSSDGTTWTLLTNGAVYSGVTTSTLTITGATLSLHNRQFRALASNVAATDVPSNSATLSVTGTAPAITAHPQNRALNAGESTTFTFAATGNPTPTLKWQISTDTGATWTDIEASATYSGVNSTTLTVSNAPLSLNGAQYRGVAINALDLANSSAASLSVTGTAPTITAHPPDRTLTEGDSTAFTFAASGNPAPTLKWQISTDAGATWTDVAANATYSGVNSGTLTVSNAPLGLNGTRYRGVATNAVGFANSSAATFTVNATPPPPPPPDPVAPTIQTHPSNQTATIGGSAVFLVSASADPTPTYQWRKDGAAIPGANGPTLNLTNVTTASAGTYTVVVSNSAGSVTSNAATLTIQGAPAFTTHPQSQTANLGANVSFTTQVSGTPAPTLQWRKNGAPIAGATGSSLSLMNLTAADAGDYSVVATNAAGSETSSTATLTVQAAPQFTQQPASTNANAGTTVTFSVQVSGLPAPTLQWRKDGIALVGATSATLTLSNVTAASTGSYTVVASNAAGTATSAAASLTLSSAPQFTAHPASQTVLAGASVTFSATASGSPTPTLQWRKGGTPIAGATSSSFTLSNVQSADAGTYDVVATNSVGSATSQPAALAVNLPSYAGVYFGDLPGGGSWALHIRADNTGTYIAFLADRRTAIVLQVTVAADGSFTVTGTEIVPQTAAEPAPASEFEPPRAAAATPVVLSGRISSGQITGSLAGLGIAFSGAIDQGTTAPATAGFYSATALGTAQGASYSIIGPSGQALAITTSPTAIDGAKGTVSPNGQLTALTSAGAQLAMTVNSQAQSVAVTYTPANTTTPVTFAGVTDAVPAVSNLVNLSVRAPLAANDTLIAGFVVTGSGTKKFLVRGIGPGLAGFNEVNPLADPVLTLHNRSAVQATNDDWGTPADAAGAIAAASTRVGAFTLAGTSRDAALLADIVPGPHTVHVAGKGGAAGVALIELYALDPKEPARLANISARTQVGAGNNVLIVGFVIDGNVPRQVLIRGIGPTLGTQFGVPGAMVDPQVELFEGQTRVALNDNWSGSELTSAFDRVGAFRLATGSRDAALLVTLKPGVHSVVLSGVGGTAGVALIEVYELP